MTSILAVVVWSCQIYAAKIFFVSAYRKTTRFQRVTDEFRRWGYPVPEKIAFFLIVIWIHGALYLLIPSFSGLAALALLPFMLVAFATLLVHGEFRRLREPAVPIALLSIVAYIRLDPAMLKTWLDGAGWPL
ncbi:MAG: DoxX family protein [Burkholderiales bacterium]|nr:DoxX family protein [Burkholderiales bacterium]